MTLSEFEINSYHYFLDLSRKLQTMTDYKAFYELILAAVIEGTQYKNTWLFIVDPASENEAFMISSNAVDEKLALSENMRLDLTSDPMLIEIMQGLAPVVVEDARTDPRTNKEIVKNLGNVSIVNFPIMLTGEVIGVLGMGSFLDEGVILPSEEELEFVTLLSSHIAPVMLRILEKESRDRYEKNLNNASNVKNQFLSSMSHELRTPLNAILGFAQLIQMDDTSKEKRGVYTQEIIKAGTHLLSLITEVLDLGKIQSNQIWIDMDTVDLNELIEFSLMRFNNEIKQKNTKVYNNLNQIEDIFIHANTIKLQHVICNILSNAVKYNNSGGSITLSVENDGASNIKLYIKDTGVGISEKLQSDIFIPFENASQENFVEGGGISLPLSRQLVKLMGGDMGLTSKEGEGSVFWISLRGYTVPV